MMHSQKNIKYVQIVLISVLQQTCDNHAEGSLQHDIMEFN